jgi:hypothetical protein
MTSGKQARLKRKAPTAPPPVRSKGAPRRKASPKVLAGAAVVLALVAAGVAVASLAFGGGSSSSAGTTPTRGSLENALPDAAVAERLFKGIPQSRNVLGKPTAQVTMIEYIDL